MRIAVIGYTGRMSKAIIDEIANRSDCTLSGVFSRKIDTSSKTRFFNSLSDLAKESDAVIDFSSPKVSLETINILANNNIVYVCGTTGFTEAQFEEFKQKASKATTIWSPNMSIGINLLQMMIKLAAEKLDSGFDSAIIDIHHKHKKDAPSGTALMLAKTIQELTNMCPQISALRIGEVPGEHKVIFSNADESISLGHNAFNRKIFASGAIRACLWAKNKPKGFYSMQDVLQ